MIVLCSFFFYSWSMNVLSLLVNPVPYISQISAEMVCFTCISVNLGF